MWTRNLSRTLTVGAVWLASGCGGQSDAEVAGDTNANMPAGTDNADGDNTNADPGGDGNTTDEVPGDSNATSDDPNATDGTAGDDAMTGDDPATDPTDPNVDDPNTGDPAGDPMPDGACPATLTEAMRLDLSVTWPASLAGNAGSGTIYIWNLTSLEQDGDAVTGTQRLCGTLLPPAQFNVIGQVVAGDESLLLEFPDDSFEADGFPSFELTGTGSGQTGPIAFAWTSLLGVDLPDPTIAWPDSGVDLTTTDPEGDSNPGFTLLPRSDSPYTLPPTALTIGGAQSADQVYTVSRNIIAIEGMRTDCDAHSGVADVSAFDNHVVGCHVAGAAACTPAEVDFQDQNRLIYSVGSATYQSVPIDADASCADVRAALPISM